MQVRIEHKTVIGANFMHLGKLLAAIRYREKENGMICQYIGKKHVTTFWESCWNDGKDIDNAIERMQRELQKEHGKIDFIQPEKIC